jgi:hypothetical protein
VPLLRSLLFLLLALCRSLLFLLLALCYQHVAPDGAENRAHSFLSWRPWDATPGLNCDRTVGAFDEELSFTSTSSIVCVIFIPLPHLS